MEASKVIDYEAVEPVSVSVTVAMINNFVLNTTSFLNKFSYLCEEKLSKVDEHIQHLEVTLALFEAKLASVPEVVPVAQSAQPTESVKVPDGDMPPMPTGLDEEPPKPSIDDGPPMPKGMTNREDPRYKKFFDRLQYGVGLAQVQGAMMNEGIANYMEILENPDAPSGGVKEDSSSSEESDSFDSD